MTGTAARENELLRSYLTRLHRRTDAMFGVLLVVQYFAGIVAALVISPRTWSGPLGATHIHVWTAVLLGGLHLSLPLALILFRRGEPITRHTIAVAQMLFSAMLIHLTGGRIETHFHVFGSLAFLAIYRDWRVLVPATVVVGVDHIVRGLYWPESVFGVLTASAWRSFEHIGWVLFENVFLTYACVQGTKELRTIASAQAQLERSRDMTERAVVERTRELEVKTDELRASEERFALAVRGSRDGIWDWDLETSRVYYAPRWKELLGIGESETIDSPNDWFGRIVSGNLARFHDELTEHIEGRSDRLETEIEMTHADGGSRWILCRAEAIRDSSGQAIRLTGSITDISELKRIQEELRRLAQHDRLTDLPNRELFKNRLRSAMERHRTNRRAGYAVLYFDFDRFKTINDSLGHAAGDALLISIADRFRSTLREHDTAARFGGDEFAVLLDGIRGVDEARGLAQRLLDVFRQPHEIEGHRTVSTASIGLVTSDLGHKDADAVIRDADAAMYQAKIDGRGVCREYDAVMHARALERQSLEQDLHLVEIEREFRLLFEPVVCLRTGDISGFEAVICWEHPTRGPLSLDSFMHIAEETGVIDRIGLWYFSTACGQLAAWQREHNLPGLTMGVKLTTRPLGKPDLCDRIRVIAAEQEVDPSSIRFEIAETTVMNDRHDIAPVMEAIRGSGFGLAIDDFGTGHSSLSCLHRFPIQVLKIDRSFTRHLEQRREFSAIVNAIVSLSHNLNLSVIAEGIESPHQLAQLQAMDCEFGQGPLFAGPLTAARASEVLRKGFARKAA